MPELNDVDWTWVRLRYDRFRKKHFTKNPSTDRPYIRINATIPEVRQTFGVRSYAPNSEFSWHKFETLNLAHVFEPGSPEFPEQSHVVPVDFSKHPEVRWWQVHIRVWSIPGVSDPVLAAHIEPEPTEDGDAHLDGVGFTVEPAMDTVKMVLDSVDVGYQPFEMTNRHIEKL